jgi:hypothetical protein
MWKSIIYKEWLKTRWTAMFSALVVILVCGYIFLKVRHDIGTSDANNFWYTVLFMKLNFFTLLKFIPIVIGIAFALSQYFPETVDKRIKLTFHLPVDENTILLKMHLFGTSVLTTIYLILLALFFAVCRYYFPVEMTVAAVLTVLPWIISGLAGYFMVSMIILEPIWKFRVFYALIAFGFISLFYARAEQAAYSHAMLPLFLSAIMMSISILFSGYRFRKGEM